MTTKLRDIDDGDDSTRALTLICRVGVDDHVDSEAVAISDSARLGTVVGVDNDEAEGHRIDDGDVDSEAVAISDSARLGTVIGVDNERRS